LEQLFDDKAKVLALVLEVYGAHVLDGDVDSSLHLQYIAVQQFGVVSEVGFLVSSCGSPVVVIQVLGITIFIRYRVNYIDFIFFYCKISHFLWISFFDKIFWSEFR